MRPMDTDDKEAPPPDRPDQQPLPPFWEFPEDLLAKWIAVPVETPITVVLTKQDIDNLLLGLLRGGDAHMALSEALAQWTQGNVDVARQMFAAARLNTVERQNRIRHFFSSIMLQATR